MNEFPRSTPQSAALDPTGVTALVTGCAGFIGSHLCERLLSLGCSVIGVDCLTTYYEVALKKRNLAAFQSHPRFRLINDPILQTEPHLAQNADWIFHLAAQPGVRASWGTDFETYVTNNIVSTQYLLEHAAASSRLQRFVYASSSSVYGDISADHFSEECRTAPFSPYGVTKLAAEHLCAVYASNFGLPASALRFFTVFGPRQRPDMAFHRLISAALQGSEFPLYGDGTQQRDFTFVQDIIQALLLAAQAKGPFEVFNIGGGHVVSMNDVIATVEEILGTPIRIARHPAQAGDVRRTSADISKARLMLGYGPRTSLQEGLTAQIEYLTARAAAV